jgi:hypothetical protein
MKIPGAARALRSERSEDQQSSFPHPWSHRTRSNLRVRGQVQPLPVAWAPSQTRNHRTHFCKQDYRNMGIRSICPTGGSKRCFWLTCNPEGSVRIISSDLQLAQPVSCWYRSEHRGHNDSCSSGHAPRTIEHGHINQPFNLNQEGNTD